MKDFTKYKNGKKKKSIWAKIASYFGKKVVGHEAMKASYEWFDDRKYKEAAVRNQAFIRKVIEERQEEIFKSSANAGRVDYIEKLRLLDGDK